MSKKVLLASVLLMLISSFSLAIHLAKFPFSKVKNITGVMSMSAGKMAQIRLQSIEKGDKIMIALNTTAIMTLQIQDGQKIMFQAPYSIEGRPFDFINYLLNTRRYFFISNESGDYTLKFCAITPETPFSIQTIGDSEVQISQVIANSLSFLNITALAHKTADERFSQIFMIYELGFTVQNNLRIEGVIELSKGGVGSVDLNILVASRNTFLTYPIMPFYAESGWSKRFEVNATSQSMRLGDYLSFLSVIITLDKSHFYFTNSSFVYANVLLGDLTIINGEEEKVVHASAFDPFSVPYEIYIVHTYYPDYAAYIMWSTLAVGVVLAGVWIRKVTMKTYG
jgi:hypothetical protein